MPCQSSSVMNGRNGWNKRMVWLNTKSITASVLALRAANSLGSATVPVAASGVAPDARSTDSDLFNEDSGATPESARETRALPSTALLASTYQSQYSLQKKR